MPSYLTSAEFDSLSEITISDNTVKIVLVDTANGILDSYSLDIARQGFESAMKLVAVGIIEYLYTNKSRAAVMAANSPFKSERLGSYSYQRATPITSTTEQKSVINSLPANIRFILSRYIKSRAGIVTSEVFKENEPDQDDIRRFSEFIDIDNEPNYG